MFRQLDDHMLVSGQIAPEEVAEAAAQGVTMIVNIRSDVGGIHMVGPIVEILQIEAISLQSH